MDDDHKDIIRKNYKVLAEFLKPAVEDVCAELWRLKIISQIMREDVMERYPTQRRRAEALLDLIVTRGSDAFDALYSSFIEAELIDAANILKPQSQAATMELLEEADAAGNTEQGSAAQEQESVAQEQGTAAGDQETSVMSLVGAHPTKWPSEEHLKKENIQVKPVLQNSNMHRAYSGSINPTGGIILYYNMTHKKRGRAVIINNEKFLKHVDQVDGAKIHYLSQRDGTLYDTECLCILFTQLGFEPVIHNNKTAKEMKTIIDNESAFDHTDFDCHVVIILSHGDKGIVYGTDGCYSKTWDSVKHMNYVTIKHIKDKICNTQSLRGKPKLFFIQACRGRGKDHGVEVPSARQEEDARATDIDLQNVQDTFSHLDAREESDGGDIIPSSADYFMAMATVSGKVSWRHTMYGTWFIQAIIYTFWNFAHECDLFQLMVKNFYYVMRHTIRGRVLIISNEIFIETAQPVDGAELVFLKRRDGTSHDKECLDILFTQLGAQVMIHDNLTAQDMKKIIE